MASLTLGYVTDFAITEAIVGRRPLTELLALIDRASERTSTDPLIAAVQMTDDPSCGTAVLAALLNAHFPLAIDASSRDFSGDVYFCDPLHAAASTNNASAVATLLESGAPLTSLDYNRDTPLVVATGEHAVEAALALIKGGADVNDWGSSLSASNVWASMARDAMWAPLIASLHSKNPPVSLTVEIEIAVVRCLVDWSVPLDVMREVVACGRYADEIAAPVDGSANMVEYARKRGLHEVASILSTAV